MSAPLARASTVDALAAALRDRILDGELAAGSRLPEVALAAHYDVARHSLRAAMRVLEGEGLVVLVANRGASVARLADDDVRDLSRARTLLEAGAVRIALERGPLPEGVHAAAEALAALCRRTPPPRWREVVLAHGAFHEALVAAAGSPRLIRAHAALSAELALFLVQGRTSFPFDALARDHLDLVAALDAQGPAPLDAHLAASEAALLGGTRRS